LTLICWCICTSLTKKSEFKVKRNFRTSLICKKPWKNISKQNLTSAKSMYKLAKTQLFRISWNCLRSKWIDITFCWRYFCNGCQSLILTLNSKIRFESIWLNFSRMTKPLRNVIVNSNSSTKSYSKTGLLNHGMFRAVVFKISRMAGKLSFVDPPSDRHWFRTGMHNIRPAEALNLARQPLVKMNSINLTLY